MEKASHSLLDDFLENWIGPPFDSTVVRDQNSPWSQTLVGAFVSTSKYVKKIGFKISVYIYKSLA